MGIEDGPMAPDPAGELEELAAAEDEELTLLLLEPADGGEWEPRSAAWAAAAAARAATAADCMELLEGDPAMADPLFRSELTLNW